MAGYYEIMFENVKVDFNKKLIEEIVSALVVAGCSYNKFWIGFYKRYSQHSVSLKDKFIYEDIIDGDLRGERLKRVLEYIGNGDYGGWIGLETLFENEPAEVSFSISPPSKQGEGVFICLSVDRFYFSGTDYDYEHEKFKTFKKLGEVIKNLLNIKEEIVIGYSG